MFLSNFSSRYVSLMRPTFEWMAQPGYAVPLLFVLAACSVPRCAPLRHTLRAAALALTVAAALWLHCVSMAVGVSPPRASFDMLGATVLLLVTTLALVIASFCSRYLRGEPGLQRFARAFLGTLAGASTVLCTQNLLVLGAAWMATSLSLHQLLTFYPERQAARIAAHKKFVVSRLAEACLFVGIGLIWLETRTADLHVLRDWIHNHDALGARLHVAALLVVMAVVLKSAQLPFHGWLTQVMEAPTPISALLHAGVVNLGGFVLVRLASLLDSAPLARAVLLAFGLLTACAAGVVMTTRVSVKVALAWSTCAHMGFMLVECALGAWQLAILHLVAHSFYKAHAFLHSGSRVESYRVAALLVSAPAISLGCFVARTATLAAGVGVVAWLQLRTFGTLEGSQLAMAALLAVSLVPLLDAPAGIEARAVLRRIGAGVAFAALLFGWHALFDRLFPELLRAGAASAGWTVVAAVLTASALAQAALRLRASAGRMGRLHGWLFDGFYMDAWISRHLFRLWPLRRRSGAEPGAWLTNASYSAVER